MSEEKDILNQEQEELKGSTENTVENEKSGEQTPEEKYNELNDKFLRLYAEFDNYRRRTNKEKVELIANANEKLLLDLIPTIDDFERAIANNETAEDIAAVKEGFNLIYHKFKSTLEAKGLKQMQAKGENFDSDLHEAIANVPGDETQKGKVIDDVEKGYFLNEKVIRFAKVVVGQ
ncbi:nucleotide exchange factor GrpE [Crocinitomicaceae bacterium CZZ-1]|uniref:Protein GrpE n=1 Tax=Taishania pollutisoli TaxID=2766479 RepID=A0A8J6PL16_9FLAO|nr:nucleotide exchange factor GrpE [Taishania pollutisoli]MBC9812750.1 nucleotide exchange factor GrpE [Taishania pollutisoli]NGF75976.1 nucleotide exchange factor GrpE [Fluviicola sp. SGL-29]